MSKLDPHIRYEDFTFKALEDSTLNLGAELPQNVGAISWTKIVLGLAIKSEMTPTSSYHILSNKMWQD